MIAILDYVLFAITLGIAVNTAYVGWRPLPVLPAWVIAAHLLMTIAAASGLGYVGFTFATLGVLVAGGGWALMHAVAASSVTD